MDLVAGFGGTPYIAFPSNTTTAQGGTLARMFRLYSFHRDDYLNHYHKRSNVSRTFSGGTKPRWALRCPGWPPRFFPLGGAGASASFRSDRTRGAWTSWWS